MIYSHKITKNTKKIKNIFLVQKNVPFFLAAKNRSTIGQNWSKKGIGPGGYLTPPKIKVFQVREIGSLVLADFLHEVSGKVPFWQKWAKK